MSNNSKSRKPGNPNTTRNGTQRILVLGWTQLEEALGKEQKAKLRQKIRNRMSWIRKNRPDLVKIAPVVEEPQQDPAAAE